MIASILPGPPLFAAPVDGRNFLPLLWMAAALIVGAVIIVLVGRWRKRSANLGPSASDELAQYRALYEQGAISEEEYKKLRSLLGGEIRKNFALSPRPATLASAAQPAPSGAVTSAPPIAPAASDEAPPPPPPTDEPPATGIRPT